MCALLREWYNEQDARRPQSYASAARRYFERYGGRCRFKDLLAREAIDWYVEEEVVAVVPSLLNMSATVVVSLLTVHASIAKEVERTLESIDDPDVWDCVSVPRSLR
jgi:hypothetical protein